jgi:hypothetical protein
MAESLLQVIWLTIQGSSGMAKKVAKVCGIEHNSGRVHRSNKGGEGDIMAERLACEFRFKQYKYVLFCDNQSVIYLRKNASFRSRSKHIDLRYHCIRYVLNSKQMQIEKVHTEDNEADMLTKVMTRGKLEV